MADENAGGGTPIDNNLVLHATATIAATTTDTEINVEPGSDAELHISYTALTSSATLAVALQAKADGTNWGQIAGTGTIPTTEDAPGQTVGNEIKVHVSMPVYIPKSTAADAYSGSLNRIPVRSVSTVGGSGTVTNLQIWLAPRDDGSTGPRERLYAAMN